MDGKERQMKTECDDAHGAETLCSDGHCCDRCGVLVSPADAASAAQCEAGECRYCDEWRNTNEVK